MASAKGIPKRKAEDMELPKPGEDSAERKRVLNVLAQRRYRQRKKEHVQKLEAQAQFVAGAPQKGDLVAKLIAPSSQLPTTPDVQHSHGLLSRPLATDYLGVIANAANDGFAEPTFEATSYFPEMPLEMGTKDLSNQTGSGQSNLAQLDPFATYNMSTLVFPSDSQSFWEAPFELPSIANSPQSTGTKSSSNESAGWSLTSISSPDIATEGTSNRDNKQTTPLPPTDDVQYSFPDEAHLEMIELNLLRGCMMIARRIDVQDIMWSLTATSPFTEPTMALAQYRHLPHNLQPSIVQMTVPHHPVLDILPWPSVRDKIIMVLSEPPEVRPPQAASPTALLDLVYDLEDGAEGVRISGNDPYSPNNWEVGEKVFKSWWWLFDRDVIRRSNQLRQLRGAPSLGSSMGSVLGEVV